MNTMWITQAALLAAPMIVSAAAAQDAVKTPLPISVQADKPLPPLRTDGAAPREPKQRAARKPRAQGQVAEQILANGPARRAPVHVADGADGRTWVSGDTYKASFGRDGFTYVPFLGSDAPRNYPVRFVLDGVQVGGKQVAFASDVTPVIQGHRVVFDRGVIQEIYDLAADGVEQTFVVTDSATGDVTVAMRVDGELREDAARDGLQFVNERGGVDYGAAFVVDGTDKRAIGSTFADGKIRLHVAAAQRPAGAVVIDPIISTNYVASVAQDFDHSDIAYDATNLRYMLVWQRNFSLTDIDVWSEMRDVNGALVPNSAQTIDNTGAYWHQPRVANLNAYDRFLVVAEVYVAANPVGQRFSIWGRTVDAGAPFTRGNQFLVSGTEAGDKLSPDVGGDPSMLTPSYWTVAYTREFSATDHDIHARQIEGTGVARPSTLFIDNTAGTLAHDVEISQANGNVSFSRQRWMFVYVRTVSGGNRDIWGASITWDGQTSQSPTAIDNSAADTISPSVSSAMEHEGTISFGVVYRLSAGAQNLIGSVVDEHMAPRVPATNLTSLLGTDNASLPRIETDGCRFVVAFARGAPAYVATIAAIGNAFVAQEAPVLVDASHDAWAINLTARANGGRVNTTSEPVPTHYGLIYVDKNTAIDRVVMSTYAGHGPGGFTLRNIGCQGLGLTVAGQPWLGGNATITLNNTGADLVGMLLGVPSPGLPLCPGCQLGIDLAGPVVNLPNVGSLPLSIPCLTNLAGSTVTVQGYSAGSGTCLGVLRLSPALDIAIQ